MSFEIKAKTKIEVSIYGQVYNLTKPTVKQASELASLSDSTDKKDNVEKTIQFMVLMGLPREVSESMEIDHFSQLVEFLMGSVKKN